MTIQTGTPDWNVPLSPKVKRLIDSDVTLAAGAATLGPFDVTGYTGILVEHLAITAEGSFGLLQFVFDDPQLTEFTPPTYVVNWKGDKAIKLNVPVMGPRVTLQYQGTFNGHQSHCTAVAHMGGGAAGFGRNATVLASASGAGLAPGASVTVEPGLIREGPASLTVQKNVSQIRAYVTVIDHLGVSSPIADVTTGTDPGRTAQFWLPPYPAALNVVNAGAGADSYGAALVLGRS